MNIRINHGAIQRTTKRAKVYTNTEIRGAKNDR